MTRTSATINVPRLIAAMEAGDYTLVAAAAVCGVSTRTITTILRGEWPTRLDAFYRVVRGLGVPMEEALHDGSSQKARLYVLPHRFNGKEIA